MVPSQSSSTFPFYMIGPSVITKRVAATMALYSTINFLVVFNLRKNAHIVTELTFDIWAQFAFGLNPFTVPIRFANRPTCPMTMTPAPRTRIRATIMLYGKRESWITRQVIRSRGRILPIKRESSPPNNANPNNRRQTTERFTHA